MFKIIHYFILSLPSRTMARKQHAFSMPLYKAYFHEIMSALRMQHVHTVRILMEIAKWNI